MKSFIKPIYKRPEIDEIKLNIFVELFNKEIKRGKHSINTFVNNAPILSDKEFEKAQKRAKMDGYILKRVVDNYQSITYTLKAEESEICQNSI